MIKKGDGRMKILVDEMPKEAKECLFAEDDCK